MTALASSSGQQLIVAQQVSSQSASSALAPVEQGIVEERDSGPQMNDSLTRPQSLDSHASNTMTNKESDLLHCQNILDEVMDMKNWQYNHYFLKPVDSPTPASRDAEVGPMTLGTMKEKLARGAYASGVSFKTDFDTMVADCKRLNLLKTVFTLQLSSCRGYSSRRTLLNPSLATNLRTVQTPLKNSATKSERPNLRV